MTTPGPGRDVRRDRHRLGALVHRRADDKKRARLHIISHLLSRVPYKPPAHRDITLPKRQPPGDYPPPDLPLRYIPTPF